MHYVAILLVRLLDLVAALGGAWVLYASWHKKSYKKFQHKAMCTIVIGLLIFITLGQAWNTAPSFDFFTRTIGPGAGPQLPLSNDLEFLSKIDEFPEVDVAKDPTEMEPKKKSYDILHFRQYRKTGLTGL
ncbi:MAG: hypothetical protein ACE5FT_06220 [Candidatus Nanoarchaeia archaeon]